jgi:acetylornithine deacetylase
MLEAHADTVAIDGMTIEPFAPAIRDGKLFGRGSCDDKGPMAAMLLAIRSVLASGPPRRATLYFVSTCDEELGSFGAHHLMAGAWRPDAAVVGEPTDLAIVHAHKGAYRFRLVTHGRAAHSSNPSVGVSAITPMAAIVQALDASLAPAMKAQGHPLLGPPTVSIGTIRGGSQVNIVPARCEIEVDCRVLPGETSEGVAARVRERVEGILRADARLSYSMDDLEWYPAFEQDLADPIMATTRAACQEQLGSAQLAAVPWASNAGVFHAAGVPSVLFGPGSIKQAHTADEHIALDEVVRAAAVYAEIIQNFA